MDFQILLRDGYNCPCGRRHQAGIRYYAYQEGILDQIPRIIFDCIGPSSTTALVSDARTWQVSGQKVYEILSEEGIAERMIIPDAEHGGPVCDSATVESLKRQIASAKAGFVIGVGSGVINDLCKWASFDLNLPYMIVATAASMNGYAAANVAPMIDGVKVLVRARPPIAVVAEPAVIENAPYEMTAAGFGDTIAKFQSNCDWRLNHALFDEYYCPFCAGLVDEIEGMFLAHPQDIQNRKPQAIEGLFEALFRSGMAMTLVGTSAPASGGEHLLSHTLDMASAVQGRKHDLHGRQVGLGVILSALLYEQLLQLDRFEPVDLPPDIDRTYWRQDHVIRAVSDQYNAKMESIHQVRNRLSNPDQWCQLKLFLQNKVKSPAQIKHWLRQAGAAYRPQDIGSTSEQLLEAVRHMHEIRNRFTVVDLAWMAGIMPAFAEMAVGFLQD